MSTNKNDYEHMLFYFAYKTFITTADEIIEKYGMSAVQCQIAAHKNV